MVNEVGHIIKQSFFQKMRKAKRLIDKQGTATVSELIEIGQSHAKSYAPYLTGDVHNSIKRRITKKNNVIVGKIYISPKQPQDGRKRNLANFDLVRWMHTSGKAREHFNSGNPQFMYRTSEYLNRITKGTATKHFNKINIK